MPWTVYDSSGNILSSIALTDNSVTNAKMANDAIDSAELAAGSVDLAHMSAESVDSDQYLDGSIDRVHLAADIIDGTKIADNVINSEHYVAASIDNEHLADDAVGVAELSATGTASSSTFLRGDNAWAAAGAGGLVLINTVVASDDATIEITGLNDTYDTYLIGLSDLHPISDGVSPRIRVGDSSGVDSGGTDYAYASYTLYSSSAGPAYLYATGAPDIRLVESVGTTAGEGCGAMLTLSRGGDGTTYPMLSGVVTVIQEDGKVSGGTVIGRRNALITLDRVQFLFSGGNVATGRMTVWGVAHA